MGEGRVFVDISMSLEGTRAIDSKDVIHLRFRPPTKDAHAT
jgi:hypothetical protein